MIILDTNIVSEMMLAEPDVRVATWMNNQDSAELYITSITVAEVVFGFSLMAKGKRRSHLEEKFEAMMSFGFRHRVLPFESKAADQCGKILAHCQGLGRPIDGWDAQIAAIAFVHAAQLATRNIKDFVNCGLILVNPFLEQPALTVLVDRTLPKKKRP